jgi:hypothetical protein
MNEKARTRKFQTLCKINPTLKKLEQMCELLYYHNQNELLAYWYETIKPVMVRNVGASCGHEELADSDTYHFVYQYLTKKLGMEG